MKYLLDIYFNKTKGWYPFFKYCPKRYQDYYLRKKASDFLGYNYDDKNPKTLNEKIRWLIFNEKKDLKTKLTDKILLKSYIADKLGPHHSAEIFGIWDKFEDIDFSSLPNSFALKANHGYKMNIIVKNKTFIYRHYKQLRKMTNNWLKVNFGLCNLEPQYYGIKRHLFAEYMRKDTYNNIKEEYKVHCFNEEPLYIELPVKNKGLFYHFYNTNWQLQQFSIDKHLPDSITGIEKPIFLDEMLKYSKALAKGLSYVRIDFVYSENSLQIVEMTFTPWAGFMPFKPLSFDYELGNILKLPAL